MATGPTPHDPAGQRRRNVRLGIIMASIAAAFLIGFVVKIVLFTQP